MGFAEGTHPDWQQSTAKWYDDNGSSSNFAHGDPLITLTPKDQTDSTHYYRIQAFYDANNNGQLDTNEAPTLRQIKVHCVEVIILDATNKPLTSQPNTEVVGARVALNVEALGTSEFQINELDPLAFTHDESFHWTIPGQVVKGYVQTPGAATITSLASSSLNYAASEDNALPTFYWTKQMAPSKLTVA